MNNYTYESGRSLTEMLGVLAVIGVLSIGTIMAYRSAMDKHQANEIINGLVERVNLAHTQLFQGGEINLSSFNNAEGEDKINDLYLVSLETETDFENEFELTVSGMTESICEKVVDMGWTLPIKTTDNCDSDEPAITFAFADDGDNTKERKCSEGLYGEDCDVECSGGHKVYANLTCTCEKGYVLRDEECQFCPDGEVIIANNGTQFCMSKNTMLWNNAKTWCETQGLSLASFSNMCPGLEAKVAPWAGMCPNLQGTGSGCVWSSAEDTMNGPGGFLCVVLSYGGVASNTFSGYQTQSAFCE